MRVRNKLRKLETPLYGKPRLALHHAEANKSHKFFVDGEKLSEVTAEILKVTTNGICFAVDAKQRTFAFRLNQVEQYAGESPSEIGLTAGQKIKMAVKNGVVVSVAQPA